jgi:hypothetical protein
MKISVTFEKTARFWGQGQEPSLKIWMRFTECTYDEFHEWIDSNEERLEGKSYDIGHSDKVIYFR